MKLTENELRLVYNIVGQAARNMKIDRSEPKGSDYAYRLESDNMILNLTEAENRILKSAAKKLAG